VTIFSDHFASGLGNWTAISNPMVCSCAAQGLSHLAQMEGGEGLQRTISTSGYSNIKVHFQMMAFNTFESGECVQALWYDGSTWTELKRITQGSPDADGLFRVYEYTLPSGANSNPNFALKFYTDSNNGGWVENGHVDDVIVKGTQ